MSFFINRRTIKSILPIAFVTILYSVTIIRAAWISDDAFITFRTIENFNSGYGLVYNIGERVQTFTHPLWLLSLSTIYFITSRIGGLNLWAQLYYINIFLSIILSIISVAVLAFGIARSVRIAVIVVLVLTFSKAFVDYSTSGLENPLSHFLLAFFLLSYLRKGVISEKRIFMLAGITSLAALNRLDTILFYLPALAYLFWRYHKEIKLLRYLVIGLLPILIWVIFSIIYYGSPFPNTAFAKLNTGIDKWQLFYQGGKYFINSIRLDPITLSVIGMALVWVIGARRKRLIPLAAGILMYSFYVLSIGGDFMSGRFFSMSLFASVALFVSHPINLKENLNLVWLFIILIGFSQPTSPLRSPRDYGVIQEFRDVIDVNGIADERGVYYPRMGFLRMEPTKPFPGSRFAGPKWVYQGYETVHVELVGKLGVLGYQAGPNIHVIDKFALADPLLARLPIQDPDQWRIGHFIRVIPDGYLETLSIGNNVIHDANINLYYEKIFLITHGELSSWDRIIEIWNINIGKYDYLIDAYMNLSDYE